MRKERTEPLFMNAYTIELKSGAFLLRLFKDRYDAKQYGECYFDETGETEWQEIHRQHGAKIIKVVVRKEDW